RRALCGFERSRGLQLRDRLREDGAYEALHVSRALHKALPDELLQSVGVRKGSGGEAAVRQLQERKQRWQVRAHTRKYFCARGKRSAGGQVARSASMRTSYVSGSTSIRGIAALCSISALPRLRVFFTATAWRRKPSSTGTPASIEAALMNVSAVCSMTDGWAPNMGR